MKEHVSGILAKTFVFVCVFVSQSQASFVTNYGYPYQDPIFASATYAILKESAVSPQFGSFVLFPARRSTPLLENRHEVTFSYYKQKNAASLIFVLSGLGGHHSNGSSKYLGEFLFREGHHVVVLNNPLHWQFGLSSSSKGMPGITADDASDIYEVMKSCLEFLKNSQSVKIKKVGLLGWSLGGLEAAFVAAHDATQKDINFQTTLLINPPVDLIYGITSVDDLEAIGSAWTDSRRANLRSYALGVVLDYMKRDINHPDYFKDLDKNLQMTSDEVKYVIGDFFRMPLAESIFASQQVNDLGVLPTKDLKNRRRIQEAGKYSYMSFVQTFVLKFWEVTRGAPTTVNHLNDISSLSAVDSFLRQSSNVYLMHNIDDFLITDSHVQYLESTFGQRATIYPKGGHMGNVWFPDNKDKVRATFASLK